MVKRILRSVAVAAPFGSHEGIGTAREEAEYRRKVGEGEGNRWRLTEIRGKRRRCRIGGLRRRHWRVESGKERPEEGRRRRRKVGAGRKSVGN